MPAGQRQERRTLVRASEARVRPLESRSTYMSEVFDNSLGLFRARQAQSSHSLPSSLGVYVAP